MRYHYDESKEIQYIESERKIYSKKSDGVKCVYSISLRIQLSLLPSGAAKNVLRELRDVAKLPYRQERAAFAGYSTIF